MASLLCAFEYAESGVRDDGRPDHIAGTCRDEVDLVEAPLVGTSG